MQDFIFSEVSSLYAINSDTAIYVNQEVLNDPYMMSGFDVGLDLDGNGNFPYLMSGSLSNVDQSVFPQKDTPPCDRSDVVYQEAPIRSEIFIPGPYVHGSGIHVTSHTGNDSVNHNCANGNQVCDSSSLYMLSGQYPQSQNCVLEQNYPCDNHNQLRNSPTMVGALGHSFGCQSSGCMSYMNSEFSSVDSELSHFDMYASSNSLISCDSPTLNNSSSGSSGGSSSPRDLLTRDEYVESMLNDLLGVSSCPDLKSIQKQRRMKRVAILNQKRSKDSFEKKIPSLSENKQSFDRKKQASQRERCRGRFLPGVQYFDA